MIIFTYNKLRKYLRANNCPAAVTDAFNNWYLAMQVGDFGSLNDLKEVFSGVDYVGNDRYVFNIMGNNYRLIAMIHFRTRTVYLLFIGTHKEYDKVDAKNVENS